ncbi:MAG: ester cyclase [Chloroflexi bacterium]|nr:ester cyclase [Chloroflexota bacterium]
MSNANVRDAVIEQLRRKLDADEYAQIRHEWITHSKAEDARDIAGLMSTLTDDCVYTLVTTGEEWRGKDGATRFYTELLTAFPDIHFDLQNIVIGPQGVFEEAHVTGTHNGHWLNTAPTGRALEWNVVIFFPWDGEKKKFKGERVHTDLHESMLR